MNRRRVVLAFAFLLLASAVGVALPGQAQLTQTTDEATALEIEVMGGPIEALPNELGTGTLRLTLKSLRGEEQSQAGVPESVVTLTAQVRSPYANTSVSGWGATLAPNALSLATGETKEVQIQVSPTRAAGPTTVIVDINATGQANTVYGPEPISADASALARVRPERLVGIFLTEPPPTVGPRDVANTRVQVVNSGLYPDMFQIEVENTGPLTVSTPGTLGLDGRESAEIPITVFGPQTMMEYGSLQIIQIQATSLNDPDATFSKAMVINVQGFYLPPWTYPLWFLLAALIAYGGHQAYKKVQRDRERYGHPGPKYSKQKSDKLEAIAEEDPEKAEALAAKLDEQWERDLEAYKERKEKGKERNVAAMQAKLAKQRKEQRKKRESAIKKVKKGKAKGRTNEEIVASLDDDEREQIQDDLPEMLAAATGAGAMLAAKDEDEYGLIDGFRAGRVDEAEQRLRAEALAKIQADRKKGRDAERIRADLDPQRAQALSDRLAEALAGDLDDVDPEAMLADLSVLERRKGEKFIDKVRKENQKLREKAIKTIKKGKKKDWSKKEILSRLDPEQIQLVGPLLPEMLKTHYPEEAELLLLRRSGDLTDKEEKRVEKLRKKLQKRRMKAMKKAAKTIEKMHEKGRPREEILEKLTSQQRWAAGDLLDVLMSPLPVAIGGLQAYLDQEDLDEDDRELWEAHLERLQDRKLKFAKKGLKHVRKYRDKRGMSPREVAAELPGIEREALDEVLEALLEPTLSARIAGIEDYVGVTRISEEEREFWEEEIEDLREQREDLAEEAVEKIKDRKADGAPPEEIAEALTPAEADAAGPNVERMCQATLPEDVDVLRVLSRDERDPEALKEAKEEAQQARRRVREEAVERIESMKDGGGLFGGDPASPEEILEDLGHHERTVLGDALTPLLHHDVNEEIAGLEAFVEQADLGEVARAFWEDHLDELRAQRDDARAGAIKKLRKAKRKDREPEEIVEDLDDDEREALGEHLERLVAAALPEDVDLIWETIKADRDPEAIQQAKEAAKEARKEERYAAAEAAMEAVEAGASPEDAVAGLPYGHRRLLEKADRSIEEILEAGPPERGGLLSFGGGSGDQGEEPTEAGDSGEGSSGGLASKLPFGRSKEDDGAWKKDLVKRLIQAGVPKSEVAGLVRRAEDEGIGDLSGRKQKKALARFVEDHGGSE